MVGARWLVTLCFLVVMGLLLDNVDGHCYTRGRGRWQCPPGWQRRGRRPGQCCPPHEEGSCGANAKAWCDCVNAELTSSTGPLATFTTFEALQTALNDLTATTCNIDPSDATTLAGCPDVLGKCLNKAGFNDCSILEKVCEANPTIEVDDLADGDAQITTAITDINAGTADVLDKLCIYYKTIGVLPNAAVLTVVTP